MAISDTSFFNSYQNAMGLTYARGYNEVYDPGSTLPQYVVNARQVFIGSMSSSDVTNGQTVISAHLNAENTYSNGCLQIVKNVLTSINNFFYQTYGQTYTRDYFTSLLPTNTVAWLNSFKESWYQANGQELVQQIGFSTWNGTNFIFYPPYSPVTNIQNTAVVVSGSGNSVVINTSPITNFALPGDIIVTSTTPSLPSPQNISLSTTLAGYANTNTLLLNGLIGAATSIFAFRSLKNPEYLEFRFGTSGATGLAATSVLSNVSFNVTLNTGGVVGVSVTSGNQGRVTIGTYGITTFKTTGISNVVLTSGSISGLGTQPSFEVWVKSVN